MIVDIADHGDIRATECYSKEHHSPARKTAASRPSRRTHLPRWSKSCCRCNYGQRHHTQKSGRVHWRHSYPNIRKKRIQLEAPDEELVEKRYKGTCFACGRQGHRKQDCSFLEQGHPNANIENAPWSESTNGKAWALKGKSLLPGNITLSGNYFHYTRSTYPQVWQGSDQSLTSN